MDAAGPSVRIPREDAGPKFDMHLRTSKLSQSDLDDLIVKYNIPIELEPTLPEAGMTMNRVPKELISDIPQIGFHLQDL